MIDAYELAIIGMGPAGIGVATALQETELIRNTICFERGSGIDNKTCVALNSMPCCDAESCHIISGIGGASNLSSGKLSFFPAGSGLTRFFSNKYELMDLMSNTIDTFRTATGLSRIEIDPAIIDDTTNKFAVNNIEYKYYDVYEFEGKKYREFLSKLMIQLITKGLCVHKNTEVVSIAYDPTSSFIFIMVTENGSTKSYLARNIVFAGGSSEIEDYLLSNYVNASKTSYEIGLRIEAKSKCFGNLLDAHGDLKLKYNLGRTYCVTRSGAIVSYKTNGLRLLEGYIDEDRKTEYTNLAVLIKTNNSNDFYEFLNRYKTIHEGVPVRQLSIDYISGRASIDPVFTTLVSSRLGDINNMFTESINLALKEFINHVIVGSMGLNPSDLVIIAPELKIARDIQISDKFEVDRNLFVVGAASGRFRGILQSFCSGIQCGKYLVTGR